jgi:hypothetical protein
VLALTCFGPRELQEWFTFAAAHKRARAHIHLLQVHVLCRYLPDEIALFAREQARRCCDEAPDESELSESEFDYWATIGGTAGPPDLNYHCWLDHELRPRRATRNRRFYWRLLWVRTAPDALLKKAVADGSMLELLGKEESRALLFANRTIEDWTVLTATIDQLFALPLDDVGRLLWLANRDVDLARWGHVIFAKALERVGHPPFERKFWGTTIFERDATGRIAGSNCDSEGLLPSEPQQEPLRPKPTSPHNYAKDFSIEERNRAASAALKVWRGDLHALHAIDDGALSQFNAFRALETWRDGQPTDFRRYTKELLTVAVERPGDAYHIGGFVSAAVDALVPLEPEFAYDIHSQLQHSSMRVTLINDYGASTFAAAMWRSAEKGNQRATALCRRLCEASTTDEEIARLAVVALAEGAEATLLSLCNDLLDNELAKERSLAVSLLAWVPKDTAINRLRELVALDTSGWIRLHAEWALEVAQHERAVRDFYRATLKVTDVNSVLSRLQVLLPALTLSATSWHRQIYDDELVEQHTPKEVEAALAAFWYNFRHRSSTPPGKIFNRDLREYLRGECIRDLRMPKPRLLNG